MKIAYIVPSLIKSGPIKVVHQIISGLQKNHEIDVFYFKVPDREKLLFDVPTHKIDFTHAIDFDAYDVIHSHTILADAYVWYHRKKIGRAKTVTTIHNYAKEDLIFSYGRIKGNAMVWLWNMTTSKHNKVVVLSRDAEAYYRKFWKNKNISYVYNGIEAVENLPFKVATSKSDRSVIKIGAIASAGGVNFRKGLDQMIRALPKLPHHQLYIAGKETAEAEKLKMLAQKIGVEDRIVFMGFVSDIETFIGEMDLFVVASRSEGFPLSLQEIVKYQKPAVCSNIAIFQEVFDEEEVTFFELENIDSLVGAIETATKDSSEKTEKAFEKFRLNYTTEQMARNYLEVYEMILKESDSGQD
ncbi:Glycosyltransferase [hydrothermal vent metagenome]|uniref:Glycosyltransferase n=1 Tax=hydrothermal vent metagenome TaxID=652676 RepID=A0A1W1C585_9ZZZZ